MFAEKELLDETTMAAYGFSYAYNDDFDDDFDEDDSW